MIRLLLIALSAACVPKDAPKPISRGAVKTASVGLPVYYSTKATPADAEQQGLYNALVKNVPQAKRLVVDGRLARAMNELANSVGEDGSIDYAELEYHLQNNGIVEPSPHLIVVWGQVANKEEFIRDVSARVASLVSAEPFDRFAVALQPRKSNGVGVGIVALHESHIEMDPLKRHVQDGSNFIFRGRIDETYRSPQVFVTGSDGRVSHVYKGTTQSFSVPLGCDKDNGKKQVELTATGVDGTNVLANFAVWCRQPPPIRYVKKEKHGKEPSYATESEAERIMLSLINRERKQYGLAPLKASVSVDAVAKGHSIEMHQTGFVAHQSPTTGSATERVQRSGIKTAVVLENVARAYGILEAHEGLMNSPGHRMNILSKDATHVGLGIVFGETLADRKEVFVTQVFIRETPLLDIAASQKQVVNKLKKAWAAPNDPMLSQIAARHAHSLANGTTQAVATNRTNRSISKNTPQYRTVVTATLATSTLDRLSGERIAQGRKVGAFGVGIAQGTHHQLGERTIFVVILLAN